MSDDKKEEETQPNTFTSKVQPAPTDKTQVKQEVLDTSVQKAQETIVSGLSKTMTEFQVENMKKLAPKDEFEINGKVFKRRKMKPSMIKELRKAEKIYAEDVEKMEDSDLRLDRDYQLLAFKANLYFGMTNEEFEDTDVEYLQTVIQATELRTQGFRQY